jgi:ABC-2 type transport system ATP-binding protein
MNIIEIKGLSFSYFFKKPVLQNIHLTVPRGCIYGYLGKNGAGKSTTLKALLGLLHVPDNTVFLFNKDIRTNRLDILGQTGSLIESASYYGNLTAWENLCYLSMLYKLSKRRIDEILDITRLKGHENKKVKYFSTGMKQRLALGMALFHDPELLILDEPINGLDPEGVMDLRNLLVTLNKMGKTIFLSSHILSEIEKTCSQIGIIHNGKIIYQGSIKELLANAHKQVKIFVNNFDLLSKVSAFFPIVEKCEETGYFSALIKNKAELNAFIRLLVNNDVEIYNINVETESLESIFMNLTHE